MRTKSIASMLLIAAAVFAFASNEAKAGGIPGILIPPGLPGSSVNVHVTGYLPAPPGVHVQMDAGRPYYVQSDRRVYIEKEGPRKHDKHKHKKQKKHHDDNGNKRGHDKHEGNGGRGGHGR